jgi:hypothetical protein
MKQKQVFLGARVVLVLVLTALLLLLTNPTLATTVPDRETAQSKITILPVLAVKPGSEAKDQNHADPPLPREGTKSKIDTVWSSGWVDITPGASLELTHNLGGDVDDHAVQVWFRGTDAGGYGVNNRAYGSLEDNGVWSGVFWRTLTDSTISVGRQPADTVAEQVRVWIWTSESSLEYCTAWAAIVEGTTVTVNHNLGGDVDDYVVKLWFRNPASPVGIHQIYYGGAEGADDLYGAYWHGLDATQVQVTRYIDDIEAEEFRLCVSVADPPDWDSTWVAIDPDETLTLNHNLGGSINRYIVRTEFKSLPQNGASEAPMAIHQFAYGGDASNVLAKDAQYLGANWQNLTNQTIDVYRWADDPYADQVRVRIWLRRMSVYLPVVFKNYP